MPQIRTLRSFRRITPRFLFSFLAGLVLLAIPLAAFADNLEVDGDGLVPVASSAMNLGNLCVGNSASGNALLAIKRTGGGALQNVFSNGDEVTISAAAASDPNVSRSFTDTGIGLPGNWTGAANNTLSSDTATSQVTVAAAGAPGAKSATIDYTATGTRASDGTALVRSATLTINWTVVVCDTTPPVVTPMVAGIMGANGWYISDVNASWLLSDPESPLYSTGCEPVTINTDTPGLTLTCTATSAGGSTTVSYTYKRDATPPTISGSRAPAANSNGWNNSDVTVSFTCADDLSGIDGCGPNQTLSADGAGQSAEGIGTDAAGNQATLIIDGISIDKTPPAVSGNRTPDATLFGWNNSDVTVSFSGSDDGGSGIDRCSAPAVLSGEGEGQSASGSCTDNAGNSASATVDGINIDMTPPAASAAASPAANSNGWNNSDVTVSYSGADDLSGIAACSSADVIDNEGANQPAWGFCLDRAGNSSGPVGTQVSLDKTAPTISGSPAPAANSFGWNNSDVTVSFTCSDALSGIDRCSAPTVLGEGAGQSASGSATDLAGNSAVSSVGGINIDKTAPGATAAASPAANGSGWNNSNVTVSFSGSDALSGIDRCSTPVVLSGEGPGQSASGACTDKAGNSSADATASGINIDRTKPVTSVVGPAQGASYFLGSVPAAACSSTDAPAGTASGIATEGTAVVSGGTSNGVGTRTATCSGAMDRAGNAAMNAIVTYTVRHNFSGLRRPVDPMPTLNQVKAGSAIPLKFSLSGYFGLGVGSGGVVTSIGSAPIACDATAPIDLVEETVPAAGNSFNYDAAEDQYNFVWKTEKSWTGCRQLTMVLEDGTIIKANFKFTK